MLAIYRKIAKSLDSLFYKYSAPVLAARIIRHYFSLPGAKSLNLGCGNNLLPDWLNCDATPVPGAVFLDCTKTFPFPSGSFDHVFAEHLIEHMGLPEMEAFLQECHRVLKPGGTIRLVTPNLDTFMQMIITPLSEPSQKYMEWYKTRHPDGLPASPVRAINSIFHEHGHKFIMNESFMSQLLAHAGFVDTRVYATGKSRLKALCGIDKHGTVIGDEINQIESLAMEATRP